MVLVLGCPGLEGRNNPPYKSLGELFPEKYAQMNGPALGEVKVIDGVKHRLLAEVKYPDQPIWFHFVDTEPLEGSASGAIAFWLCESGHIHGQRVTVEDALMSISIYCKNAGVSLNDIIHLGPGVDNNKLFLEPLPDVKSKNRGV